MAGLATVETKLEYRTDVNSSYTVLEGLMEVPELGGDVEKLEVTTLTDRVKKYIPGLRDFGDLAFNFLYDNSSAATNYRVLKGLEAAKTLVTFKVTYPDTTGHEFSAYVSCKMNAASVNGILTFTCNLSLQSDITTTHPA